VPPTRNPSREVPIGSITIGNPHPVAVQSMTATRTRDIDATVAQVHALAQAGAAIVRIAADSRRDAEALAEIRRQTSANLSVDLQENYRLAEIVAPHVDKIRYNPGHLYHHQPEIPWREKVRYLVDVARQHDCALRVGVNCGSVDPETRGKFAPGDSISPMLASIPYFSKLCRYVLLVYCTPWSLWCISPSRLLPWAWTTPLSSASTA